MSFLKAKEYLKNYNLDDRIIEFSESTATVSEAAHALGCKEEAIAKSLSFLIDDKPIMILVAGDCKIDNAKYKAEFSTKAKMIPFDDVEKYIGHAAGGVCPFGINDNVVVYLDESLKKLETLYPACGNPNSAVRLNVIELEKVSNYKKWVNVCKDN